MQVLLNSDPHTDGRHEMADHVDSVVRDALARFGAAVTRVQAHLSSAAHPRHPSSPEQITCKLEARLVGLDAVVVTDHADNAHQAIRAAVTKLQRAITSALARHDPLRGAVPLKDLDLAAGDDLAGHPTN